MSPDQLGAITPSLGASANDGESPQPDEDWQEVNRNLAWDKFEAERKAWYDLAERLTEKARTLDGMAERATLGAEANRLIGKAEGVRLALSFINEHLREGMPNVIRT